MNKFAFNQAIKKSSLTSSEKLILLEILSFIENDKEFYGTNNHLASIFNFSESYIKKIISKFQKLGIIESKVDKKKHTKGDQTWYNKRYITINFEILSNFLQVDAIPIQSEPISSDLSNDIQPIEPSIISTELIPEIEENSVFKVDDDIDDEAQDLWYQQQIENLTITPKVSEPIIVNDDKGYSEIEFKLNNGTIVYVQTKFAEHWFEIEKRPRVLANLRTNSSQFGFDRQVKDKIEEIISQNELLAKYQ